MLSFEPSELRDPDRRPRRKRLASATPAFVFKMARSTQNICVHEPLAGLPVDWMLWSDIGTALQILFLG
jgi:hypothetical protein